MTNSQFNRLSHYRSQRRVYLAQVAHYRQALRKFPGAAFAVGGLVNFQLRLADLRTDRRAAR